MTTTHLAAPLDRTTTVRERVHVLMFRLRVTQAMLGKVIGVSQTTMGKKLRGEVPITLTELLTMADYLGVSAAELVDERPDPVTSVATGENLAGGHVVRHQGLEPRTRWFGASLERSAWELAA